MTYETGLAWLAEQCMEMTELLPPELDCLVERGPVSAMVLIAERSVSELDGSAGLQLGRDVRRLLDSTLPEETMRTAWAGSTDHAFDPCKEDVGPRAWLKRIESAWLAAEFRRAAGFVPPAADPVTGDAPRAAALRAIGRAAADLTLAHEDGQRYNPLPQPGLVPALEQVIVQVCADLGYRLFLRAMKMYDVAVDTSSLDAFVALGKQFGYPDPLVEEGLNQR
ncbi:MULTISPECIES: hypothetical protein [unclassified Streptomyces]|uniref:hypothetical protein n=1 Tax=unclassified Streptomyces TaxID=2593676 RepID=UPI00093E9B93|nr:hypothetical protein [Streptomyces sp. TSRI0281]OKI40091.1 hypothetical protein A6A29_39980 [Streptomyces sp. TSRI0281]